MHIFRTDSAASKGLLIAAAVLVAAGAYFAAKWNLANAFSTRADTADLVDLAVALAPDDPQTHYAAGAVYQKTFDAADVERSLAEFERAAALAPNNYLAWLELGRAYGRSGDNEKSLAAMRRALDLAPNYADVQWSYGNALIRTGKFDEGFELVRAATAAKSSLVGPAVGLAMQLSDSDVEGARRMLGDRAETNTAMALYLARAGRLDDALSSWNRVELPLNQTLSETLQPQARALEDLLRQGKKFRAAARVAERLWAVELVTGTIVNGGFESTVKVKDALPYEWQIGPGAEPQIALSTGQKRTGDNSLLMVFNTTQAADSRSVSQTFAVEPGVVYEFEAFYKAELKTLATLRWEVYDAGSGTLLAATPPLAAQSDWQSVAASVTVPVGTDGLSVRLVRTGCTSTICPAAGRVWLDDVSIRRKN